MRLGEPRARITIVDDTSRGQACAGNCGVDWSGSGVVSAARQRVRERFGERAELDYVDLTLTADSEAVRRVKAAVQGLPLPVMLANGRPRIAGQFDLRQVMDVIEVNLEAEL
jgi:hypothetical protein